jgi:terminase, large subunit
VTASPDVQWLCSRLSTLTTRVDILLPSEWAEQKRYLPQAHSALPGYYRFSVTPYMREVLDCMSPESDVRAVTIAKGVQVGATTVIENALGYCIACVKTAPCMLISADQDLAKIRMETFIIPMLSHSGLDHLVRSVDEQSARKTGRTSKRLEWEGGGFLIPIGAQNANKLRSVPIQYLFRDEVDGWPDGLSDGDPVQLSEDRTAAFEASRKIMSVSTPLIKGSSKIWKLFEQGDQRYYHVKCLSCRHPQALRWKRTDKDTGTVSGIVWESHEDGRLVEGSVRYLCEQCGHPHSNDDKTALFADGNAEWVPTAVPQIAHHRSYHISALYSPVGMQSWEACAQKWLTAWDERAVRPRDLAALMVFYNNVLGKPFEVQGQKLSFEIVSSLRRHEYRYGQIPNKWAAEFCGSRVLIVTCAVDVHKANLGVSVFGWCRGRRALLLNYWRFEGNTEDPDDAATWGRLQEVILTTEYAADDGQRYRIQLTLIDSGFQTDHVYRFCERFTSGVFPVRGRASPPKNAPLKEFWSYAMPSGMPGWAASVDLYKERWSASLRRSWDGLSVQPEGFFNAPLDATDAQLRELTVEVRREKVDKVTGKRVGVEWFRPSGADNTLWDTLVYNHVALDIIAFDICIQQMGRDSIDWETFWSSLQ